MTTEQEWEVGTHLCLGTALLGSKNIKVQNLLGKQALLFVGQVGSSASTWKSELFMHKESNVTEAVRDSQLKMNRGFHNSRDTELQMVCQNKGEQQTAATCCLSQRLS